MRYAITAGLLGLGLAATALVATSGAEAASGVAPGAPGATAIWTAGDKDGFGTATTHGEQGLVHARRRRADRGLRARPRHAEPARPAVRRHRRQVVHRARARGRRCTRIALADPRSLTYRQVNTARSGRWRITKTYVTDPAPLGGAGRRALRVAHRPPATALRAARPGAVEHRRRRLGATRRRTRWSRSDAKRGERARRARRRSDARVERLHGHERRLDRPARRLPDGLDLRARARRATSSRSAELPLTGKPGQPARDARARLRRLRAGGRRRPPARRCAAASRAAAAATPRGWHDYLGGLPAAAQRRRPRAALRRLADGARRARGQDLPRRAASPRRRCRGCGATIAGYSGPYHLVWSRDLYQVATAQLAAGDRAAAGRALDYLWTRQQKPDGCLPQNSNLDGTPHWTDLQLDEVADPILLAWQLGRSDADDLEPRPARRRVHPRQRPGLAGALGERRRLLAGDDRAPRSPALICAAADRASATARRRRGRALPRDRPTQWQRAARRLDASRPTARSPRSPLLPAAHRRRQRQRRHDVHDRRRRPDDRPARRRRHRASSSSSGSASCRADDPDDPLDAARGRPRARRRRRPTGSSGTATTTTATARRPTAARSRADGNRGRLWPIFAGERGEYELAAGEPRARGRRSGCDAIAATANAGPDAARAGLGRPAARRAPTPGTGTLLGDAARLDARAVHPARLVDRRRPPGRAPRDRRLPLRRPMLHLRPLRTRSRPPQPTRTGERSTTPSKQPSFTSSLPDQCSVMAGCCRRTGLRRSTMMRPGRSRPGNNGVGF